MFYLSDLIILYKTLHFLDDCRDEIVECSKCLLVFVLFLKEETCMVF